MTHLRESMTDDSGFSLVELLISMMLMSILGAIVTVAFISTNQQFRIADDEAQGLADTKTVVERLGRDIRAARGVDAGASESSLVLWIDYNSDYVRNASVQADEIISWTLQSKGSGSTQFNTLRSTAGGDVRVQARTLVSDLAFCYQSEPDGACFPVPLSSADAENTQLVTVTLTYDANTATGSGERTATFTQRIRNVS